MSRFPSDWEMSFREHEAEQRNARLAEFYRSHPRPYMRACAAYFEPAKAHDVPGNVVLGED